MIDPPSHSNGSSFGKHNLSLAPLAPALPLMAKSQSGQQPPARVDTVQAIISFPFFLTNIFFRLFGVT